MFETDGSIMIFWQALGESKEGGQSGSIFTILYIWLFKTQYCPLSIENSNLVVAMFVMFKF